MSDEETVDVNGIRRHAKKMLSALDYNRKYRRIDFYRPSAKQLEFHNSHALEIALRAGNQLGKTHAGAAQMTFDALALYPEWYRGRRFDKPLQIERQGVEWIGWAASLTSGATRDGVQLKLLGSISQEGMLGTGLIPLDNIIGFSKSRGIDGFVDTITLRRETGGVATIQLKTYEQGSAAFQGVPVDLIHLDEDIGLSPEAEPLWKNCRARANATNGKLIWTATPRIGLGRTPWRRKFSDEHDPNRQEILMTLADINHLTAEEKAKLAERWAGDRNKATILYGADAQGGGGVFEFPVSAITHNRRPESFGGSYWRWLWGMDFDHGGTSDTAHPWTAVLCAWNADPAVDVIYVAHVLRIKGQTRDNHVARMREHPLWDAPICWPADGQQAHGNETIAGFYKKAGLNMQPTWTTFPQGGYALDARIAAARDRISRGKLLFPEWERELLDEYQGYHYDQNGKVVAINDDILSAVMQAVMGIRHARTMSADAGGNYRRPGYGASLNTPEAIARRVDNDIWGVG